MRDSILDPTRVDARRQPALHGDASGLLSAAGTERFVRGEEIGRGLFAAADRDLRRAVAMKVIADGGDVEAFLREARLTAGLEHPNIVPVHDVGVDAAGRAYFVMKRVEGRTPASPTVGVLLNVCDAVAFAHSRGVAHRNLTADSIIVGEFGEVVVTGWERAAAAEPVEDVRALGALVPAAAPELAAVGKKARDGGYASVKELQADLRRFLEGREVSARRDPLPVRIVKWMRRHPLPSAAAAAGLIALIAGALGAEFQTAAAHRDAIEALASAHETVAASSLAATPADRQGALEALVRAEEHLRAAGELRGAPPPNRYDVNRRLGDLALDGGDYGLADMAYSVCASIDPGRAGRESLAGRVADAEHREVRRRLDRVAAVVAEIRAGLGRPGGGQLDDVVAEASGFHDPEVVAALDEALAPIRGRAAPGVVWTQAERDLMTFAFRVLGRLGLDAAVGPLARTAEVLEDRPLLIEVGTALCLTRRPEAFRPLRALRQRLLAEVPVWRQIARYLPRVPIPDDLPAPTTAAEFNDRAVDRLDRGDAVGALDDAARAVELEPSNPTYHASRSHAHVALGRHAEAIEDLTRAIGLNPRSSYIHGQRGISRRESGDLQGAYDDLTRALDLDPDDALVRHNRGAVTLDLGRPREALDDFRRALALNPSYSTAHEGCGNAHRLLGEIDEAIAAYSEAVRLDPRNPSTLYARANLLGERGDDRGALDDFARAIEAAPDAADAYYNRAIFRQERGDLDGAEADYTHAAEVNPGFIRAVYNRGVVRFGRGRYEEAIADFTRAMELSPSDARPPYNRGAALAALERYAEAAESFTRSIEIDPAFAWAHSSRARARRLLGDREGALADLTRALELAPDVHARLARADVLAELDRFAEARADLEEVLRAFPDHPEARALYDWLKDRP